MKSSVHETTENLKYIISSYIFHIFRCWYPLSNYEVPGAGAGSLTCGCSSQSVNCHNYGFIGFTSQLTRISIMVISRYIDEKPQLQPHVPLRCSPCQWEKTTGGSWSWRSWLEREERWLHGGRMVAFWKVLISQVAMIGDLKHDDLTAKPEARSLSRNKWLHKQTCGLN